MFQGLAFAACTQKHLLLALPEKQVRDLLVPFAAGTLTRYEHPAVTLLTDEEAEEPEPAAAESPQFGGIGAFGNADEDDDVEVSGGEEEIALERVRWMFETENGWKVHPTELSSTIEIAKRAGKDECGIRVGDAQYTCKLSPTDDMQQLSDDGKNRLRRHVVGPGIAGSWETLSYKYAPPMSLRGDAVLTVLEKVWTGDEKMDGEEHGLGFLFLYSLFQGAEPCKLMSTKHEYGIAQRAKGSGEGFRLAQLLLQLYKDARVKSVPASVLNILSYNKSLCSRMPRFFDNRKVKQQRIFNGCVATCGCQLMSVVYQYLVDSQVCRFHAHLI